MDRQELIACFQDTRNRCREEDLAGRTWDAVRSSAVYLENFVSGRLYKVREGQIRVVEGTSFAVARENLGAGRLAVLNFANPHYPGGGVTQGAMAQEECLCRSSNLYECLISEQVYEYFYQYHRTKTDHDFSHRLIYTPGVTVFKDDSPVPRPFAREDWFRVDVITCAAPYLAGRRYVNSAVLAQLFRDRIRNILEVAIDREVDVLILGAFGCGAFRNPPELVARVFHELLSQPRYQAAFRQVIFAIKSSVDGDPYTVCPNIAAFQKEFLGVSEELEKLRYIGGREDPEDRDVAMPGGRIRCRGSESRAYREWVTKNPYFGKQFSVLGDAISTLEGYNPRGYNLHYTGETCKTTGVADYGDTWWGKVIDFFGGELLVNDSWSGSRVARPDSRAEQFPSACSDRRTGNLHVGAVKPDVILVYLGINDWANGIPLQSDGLPVGDLDTCFSLAYDSMLRKLRRNYPDAEIWCATLNETCMEHRPAFRFPESFGGIHIREYNHTIQTMALANGCRVLDLYGQHVPYDTADGTHPTARGMDTLAMLAVRRMADEAGGALLDCEGNHEPHNGICRRCGKPMPEVRRESSLRLKLRSTGEILTATDWYVTLGRSRENGLVLENPYVARSQATFTCREGQWYVRDNGSKNGTYLNGSRLEADMEYRIHPGDVIAFAKKEEAQVLE